MNNIIVIASIIFGVICIIVVALTSDNELIHYGSWDSIEDYKYNYEDAGDFN